MEPDARVRDLVRDYLGRLEAAAWPLSADRRRELVGEVREHIDTALTDAGASDEVTVRNVLDRLGRPEEIVEAEVQADGGVSAPVAAVAAPAAPRRSIGAVEIAGLLLLTIGAVGLPVIGPILGLVFVWISTQLTVREKTIATVVAVVLLILPIVLLFTLGIDASPSTVAPDASPAAVISVSRVGGSVRSAAGRTHARAAVRLGAGRLPDSANAAVGSA